MAVSRQVQGRFDGGGVPRDRGFTLVELLVVIAIIALLIGILLPTLAAARKSAESVHALAAVRSLQQAHALYSVDYVGGVIPGFLANGDPTIQSVRDEFGNPLVFGEIAKRWPYRLGPYFEFNWQGTTHIGSRAEVLEGRLDQIEDEESFFGWTYDVSIYPSFGLNFRYVGGDLRSATTVARGFHVARVEQALQPSSLLVFGSARFDNGQEQHDGNMQIQPPMLETLYDPNADTRGLDTAYGNLHARYQSRVVTSWLDGHATSEKPEDLMDRRKWANPAARANDPEWEPQ